MKATRPLSVIASAALLVGSLFGTAASASAQTACITWPCSSPTGPTLSIMPNPDLTVAVSASPNPVAHSGTHTYVLRVSNVSSGTVTSYRSFILPSTGPTVSDVRVHLGAYPSDERLVSFHDDTGSGFTCYTPAEYFGMDVRCIGGTIASGATAQITLTMTAPSRIGTFTSNASVDPYGQIAESNESNNGSSVSFSVF